MSLVYQHIRKDTGEVFYVGIGESLKRAYDFKGRNDTWHTIARKTEVEVKIYKDNITREEARDIERNLIKEYGRRDKKTGILANRSIGGEGDNIGGSGPMDGWQDRQKIKDEVRKMMPEKYWYMSETQYMAMVYRKTDRQKPIL